MAPHRSSNDNQREETGSTTMTLPVSPTSAPFRRRKSFNAMGAYASGPVCVRDTDPADETTTNAVERLKESDVTASDAGHPASGTAERQRKRDLVRQISMRLYRKGRDLAEDVLRNVAQQQQRMADAETVCSDKDSSLEHEIPASRKMRKHLWLPMTQDDSVLLEGSSKESFGSRDTRHHHAINEFFVSRVTDPTSYFYRFRYDDVRHATPQKAEVQLVPIAWLKAHEATVSAERVRGLTKATLAWDAYTEPLLVDRTTGAILDGHHRFTVGVHLELQQLPAVLVDYLGDDAITVDVWPGCGRATLTKHEVIAMALSPHVFPPKTSRHRFTESLPPISIPLSVLRQPPTSLLGTTSVASVAAFPSELVSETAADASESPVRPAADTVANQRRQSRLRHVSLDLLFEGAQNLARAGAKSRFRSRLRQIDDQREHDATRLDMIKRPAFDTRDLFNAVRENDVTSSFCQQRAATFEDLLSTDVATRRQFFLTRLCDPTSYFYKYHFDALPKRSPRKVHVALAALAWLKAHEHVVSWDRVDGLRHATTTWNAYLEPLLVDAATGAILDGHHRYHVGRQLGLACVPVVLVNYLDDDTITVDVWPNCGRDSLTKHEVIAMSLSDDLFPPKTSRHTFSDDLPPISVPLERLRVPLAGNTGDL